VFTWERSDGTTNRAQTRVRSATGTLSAVQTLSAAGQHAFGPQVAVEADADAVFTWTRADPDGSNGWIQARARSAAGILSAVQDVSDPGRVAHGSQVAVDADGDAFFTWVRTDGIHDRVEARSRSAAGILRPFTTLSDRGGGAGDPQVAVDPAGNALVTWWRFDATNHQRIQFSDGP
jgi:hypothetical protein